MVEVALTDIERTIITQMVSQQLLRFAGHREVRVLAEELRVLLKKIEGVDKQLVVRSP